MAVSPVPLLKPGTLIVGRWEIVSRIGAGGMAEVYEARDRDLGGRRRAVKVLLPHLVTEAVAKRFKQEACLPARLLSDNVVDILEAGIDEELGRPFLVMHLLRGEDLGTRLKRGALAPADALRHLSMAALVLEQAHAADVIHRDLKPENLFVAVRDDRTEELKVLDFGIAKIIAESRPQETTLSAGSPLYMSPEQSVGSRDIGFATDIYSLGQVAFTLLVGRAYWQPEADELGLGLLTRLARGGPDAASVRAKAAGVTLPPAFDDWFARATALDPSARFEHAPTMVLELAAVFGLQTPHLCAPPLADDVGLAATLLSAAIPRASDPGSGGHGSDAVNTGSTGAVSSTARRQERTRAVNWLMLGAGLGIGVLFLWQRAGTLAGDAPIPPVARAPVTKSAPASSPVPPGAPSVPSEPSSASPEVTVLAAPTTPVPRGSVARHVTAPPRRGTRPLASGSGSPGAPTAPLAPAERPVGSAAFAPPAAQQPSAPAKYDALEHR